MHAHRANEILVPVSRIVQGAAGRDVWAPPASHNEDARGKQGVPIPTFDHAHQAA